MRVVLRLTICERKPQLIPLRTQCKNKLQIYFYNCVNGRGKSSNFFRKANSVKIWVHVHSSSSAFFFQECQFERAKTFRPSSAPVILISSHHKLNIMFSFKHMYREVLNLWACHKCSRPIFLGTGIKGCNPPDKTSCSSKIVSQVRISEQSFTVQITLLLLSLFKI